MTHSTPIFLSNAASAVCTRKQPRITCYMNAADRCFAVVLTDFMSMSRCVQKQVLLKVHIVWVSWGSRSPALKTPANEAAAAVCAMMSPL